eukprot:NODE_230_length_13723_cov_0.393570.p1 type:complete len:900 gc:universal NODE_230_length_13723_cov_0.393570:3362-663(-)
MIISPVTFIYCEKDTVYCGVGSYLMTFNVVLNKRKYFKVFDYQRIHHICTASNKIAFNGGYLICVVDSDFKNKKTYEVNDFVLELKMQGNIKILTANSVYYEFDYDLNLVKKFGCPSQPKLYAACIDKVLVGASVFGWVVVWDENGIIKKFKAHDGFIFKVKLIDDILITCSEDRTLKMTCLKSLNVTTYKVGAGRVWNACLSDNNVFAVSEDAGVHVFPLVLPTSTKTISKSLVTLKAHEPKHVWAIDIVKEHNCFVTGGNDGGILQWPLNVNHSYVENRDLLQHSLPPYLEHEHLKYTFANDLSKTVNITNFGRIFSYDDSWKIMDHIHLKDNYYVATSVKQFILFGDITGKVLLYDILESTTKIVDLCLKCKITVIGAHIRQGIVYVACQTLDLDFVYFKLNKYLELVHKNIQKVDFTFRSFQMYKDMLIVGTRLGVLIVFDEDLNVISSVVGHNEETISDIKVVDSRIITCGRNGNVCYWELRNKRICLIMDKKITKGWTEKIAVTESGLVFLNFFRKTMSVYSVDREREILSVECGGAHRSYSYYSEEISSCKFTFLMGKKLFQFNRLPSYKLCQQIQPSLFGRELRDCQVYKGILLCGGESGFLKGYEFQDTWELRCCLNAHQTVIKGMCITNDVLVTVGGKEIIISWKLFLNPDKSLSITKLGCCPISGDIDEIRCMCLSCIEIENGIIMAVGYSDAFVRILYFDFGSNRFSHVCEWFIDSSVFSIKLMLFGYDFYVACGTSKGVFALMQFSQLGINLNNSKILKNRFLKKSLKTSNVNTLVMQTGIHDFCILGDKVYCVGDDGYLAICRIDFKSNLVIKLKDSFLSYSPLTTCIVFRDSVYISGLEQNIYRVENGNGTIVCRTTISDTARLAVLDDKLLVAGFGLELINVI